MFGNGVEGLSVVYLSGKSSPDTEGNGRYSRDDVDALRALAEEPGIVDIFMTYPLRKMLVLFYGVLLFEIEFLDVLDL